jgi:hypothetical protein
MRDLTELNKYRLSQSEIGPTGYAGDGSCGIFRIKSPIDRAMMHVIASSNDDWDHVSVSRNRRCPNWPEMDYVKRLFFHDDEVAMQLHLPATENINNYQYCLHLWVPHPKAGTIPRPPSIMV